MKASQLSIMSFVLISLFMVACGGGAETEADTAEKKADDTKTEEATEMSMMVDPQSSQVKWTGKMLGIKEHFGMVQLEKGKVSMTGDQITGGNFVIDMKSISPMDTNYTEENTQDMLIGHLSSPDFFAVDSFPKAMFTITDAMENAVKGTLTVRGQEGIETVENISVKEENGMKMVSGTLTFDRKKYDVSWDSPMKDVVLSDDIKIEVTLAAK